MSQFEDLTMLSSSEKLQKIFGNPTSALDLKSAAREFLAREGIYNEASASGVKGLKTAKTLPGVEEQVLEFFEGLAKAEGESLENPLDVFYSIDLKVLRVAYDSTDLIVHGTLQGCNFKGPKHVSFAVPFGTILTESHVRVVHPKPAGLWFEQIKAANLDIESARRGWFPAQSTVNLVPCRQLPKFLESVAGVKKSHQESCDIPGLKRLESVKANDVIQRMENLIKFSLEEGEILSVGAVLNLIEAGLSEDFSAIQIQQRDITVDLALERSNVRSRYQVVVKRSEGVGPGLDCIHRAVKAFNETFAGDKPRDSKQQLKPKSGVIYD